MPGGISGESAWRRSRITAPVANPAAGADWSVSPGAGHMWGLVTVKARLVTSAAVANRAVRLILGDSVNTFAVLPAPAVQAASLTVDYTWSTHAPALAIGPTQLSFLPDFGLVSGWTIGTSTSLIDVGDQWSSIFLGLVDLTARRGRLDLSTAPDMIVGIVELGPDAPAT